MGSTRLRTVYCTLWAAMFVTARSFAADKEHGIDRDLSDMTDIVYNKDSDNEPHYVQYDVASIPVKMTGVERFLSTFITSNGRRYPLRYATDHSGFESRPKVFNSPLLQKSAATHQKPSIGRAKMKPRTKPAKILQKAKTLKLKKTTGHYDKERHIGIPIRQKGKTRPKHNPATKENPAKQGGKLSNSDKKGTGRKLAKKHINHNQHGRHQHKHSSNSTKEPPSGHGYYKSTNEDSTPKHTITCSKGATLTKGNGQG